VTEPLLATLGLVLVTGALVMGPLVPGLMELRRRRDVTPLAVIADYERDIRHFARGFKAYVRQQLASGLPAARPGEEVQHTLPDGTTGGSSR
jgi:hypothetical protein